MTKTYGTSQETAELIRKQAEAAAQAAQILVGLTRQAELIKNQIAETRRAVLEHFRLTGTLPSVEGAALAYRAAHVQERLDGERAIALLEGAGLEAPRNRVMVSETVAVTLVR